MSKAKPKPKRRDRFVVGYPVSYFEVYGDLGRDYGYTYPVSGPMARKMRASMNEPGAVIYELVEVKPTTKGLT